MDEVADNAGGAGFFDAVLNAQNTVGGVLNNAIDSVQDVFTHGQDSVVAVADTAGSAASEAIAGAQETVRTVASPWNVFAFSAGGVGGALVVGTVAAVVADQVIAGGAGRTALIALVRGRSR